MHRQSTGHRSSQKATKSVRIELFEELSGELDLERKLTQILIA
jgi:hypothetical protein